MTTSTPLPVRQQALGFSPKVTLGQVRIDASGGRPTRQFWTGVTYTADREAGEDTGRLNRQTPIPVPDGPLEEIDLAAAIRRVLGD